MSLPPRLIVQYASGGSVNRNLAATPLPSAASGDIALEPGPADAEGYLEPPAGGEVVLSYPSPESLRREPDEVRHVIARAGRGEQPLVVVIEAAEELREDELAPLLEAAAHSSRAVILRIMGDA